MTREPGGDAGYSGTPLYRKLGIKDGATVALLGAPAGFEERLLPANAAAVKRMSIGALSVSSRGVSGSKTTGVPVGKPWDVVICFVKDKSTLSRYFPGLAAAVHPAGAVWIAWPKRSSGVATDLTEEVLRDVCLPTGMVDNKVCAIDEIWSGLRFVWRLEHRGRPRT